MKKLRNVECEVRVECRLMCLVALAVLVIPFHIPVRTGCIKVRPDVVRDVRYHELRLGDVVGFEVLEVVMDEDAFHITPHPAPPPPQRLPPHRR